MFWGILALNGAVFVCWNIARGVYESSRDPSMYIWMRNNFTVSWTNVKSGRIWTLLTSCISHEDLMHAIFNVMGFYFMAPPVISLLGNVGFLALYLGSGLVSSLTSLYWHTSVKNHPNYNSQALVGPSTA
ncbi:Presenilins-associated rhomboid-like protein, mitochondrial [Grifola frondosa]|uniref:Presenilins-associated rhomboid-like protein, mitochondrial n=1 Tax=Grifola frondosa TaxID=5627 RepID=A0A1C7MJY9_GRIFR|nr:Presenilins-associated rhomboid-like protein, mitochondrial [Grifola frondosa]